MTWVAAGVGVASLGYKVYSDAKAKNNRPKYNVQGETQQNQALGEQAAFGQNPAIAQGNAIADQTAGQDINTAQQYSSNAGTILNVLKGINSNRNQTKQGLAISDAQMRSQGRSQLMGANSAAIDEKDKAWNFNVNQPYQNQVASDREFGKGTTQNFWKWLDYSRANKLLQDKGGDNNSNGVPSYAFSDVADNGSSGFGSDLVGQEEA